MLRYAGKKAKLVGAILDALKESKFKTSVEPLGYVGGFDRSEQTALRDFIKKAVGKQEVGFAFNSPADAKQLDFLDWKLLNPGEAVAQIGRRQVNW